MLNKPLLLIILIAISLLSCKEITETENIIFSEITAKEKIDEVLVKAKNDFAPDAKLTGIYGWNVSKNGKIDLKKTDNAFVYVVQSNQLQRNEFYVPVFAAGPQKSPINFSSMLSLIKDSTAGKIMNNVFGKLSTISIDPNAKYNDSPAVIDTALKHGGATFIIQNTNAKIDLFLLPSKSIDTTLTLNNSADWIVNFYSGNKSLVLWINSTNGTVTKLSGN